VFEAVIFDWDGTLADSLPVIVASFQKTLNEVGCNVTDEFLVRRIGIGARNMFKEALGSCGVFCGEDMLEALLEKKVQIHAELADRIELTEGAQELLDSLRLKVKMGLATMSNRPVIDKLLKQKNLGEHFDFVLTVDEVTEPKPSPEVFLKCAAQLNCQPERCVVVEDSVFGVEAAARAKMKCIAVPSGAYSKTELAAKHPDLIVDSLREKPEILGFILGC
jgi:HAD superfamily hydrolase (TIGR01509 family)